MEVELDDGRLRAVDEAKTSIEVEAPGWEPASTGPDLPRPAAATVSGTVEELTFPPVFAVATDLGSDEKYRVGRDAGTMGLPAGEYVVRVNGTLTTYVRFGGKATLENDRYERTVLQFEQPTTVTIGFRSLTGSSGESVVVPRTPAGVATAISTFTAGNRTGTPDRSFPTMRGHPPLVEFGDTTTIPSAISDRREHTGVGLQLPADLEYLLPAAPLAHYTGAEVSVADGAQPTLKAAGAERSLGSLPEYERSVAELLRRVFLLDCLVRSAGPHGTQPAELEVLDRLGLDADDVYDERLDERLSRYLGVDFESVSDDLPDWHLAMYVEPTYDNLATLPYQLDNVPFIFRPSTTPLEDSERLSRSLDGFYRSVDPPSVDLTRPELGPATYHGWLAGGVPVDVFKTHEDAYTNREAYGERAGESISVIAVLNDADMEGEHSEAARIYQRRAEDLDIDIDIRERLTRAELADVFESRHDLVHYVGHCEEEGLRCVDGNLSAESLSTCRAQTFFLNACGSYYEGMDLVRKGSVAGAVTFNRVLDEHAARVGTIFARLIVHGYAIERALEISRRRVIMGLDYAVVGDGTHVLTQTDSVVGGEATLERLAADSYRLKFSVASPWLTGFSVRPHVPEETDRHLPGTQPTYDLDRPELVDYLEYAEVPVVYDGDVHWSPELAASLVDGN